MDKIIDSTIAFVPEKVELPTLYSFDIFDTLFSRKVLDPVGIFYYVQEKNAGGWRVPKSACSELSIDP